MIIIAHNTSVDDLTVTWSVHRHHPEYCSV